MLGVILFNDWESTIFQKELFFWAWHLALSDLKKKKKSLFTSLLYVPSPLDCALAL